MYLREKNFQEILNKTAKIGDKTFITDFSNGKEINITFSELENLVNRFANFLKMKGIRKGDKVAILLINSYEFVISLLAIQRLGAIPLPLNTFLNSNELKHIFKDSNVKYLISQSDFYESLSSILKETKIKKIIWKDKNISLGIESYTFIEALNVEPLDKKESITNLNDNDIALILYTSGTTGKPKGVILTYKNIFSNVKNIIEFMGFSQTDRFIIYLPMFHIFTLTAMIFTPLHLGAQIFILKSINPFEKIIEVVDKKKITVFMGIPEVYKILTKLNLPKNWGETVKYFISGGEPLSIATAKKFMDKYKGKKILEGYGLTETSPAISVNSLQEYKLGSVGKPLPDYEIKIVDRDFKDLGINKVGEVIVKGDNVMKGYFNDIEETNKVLKNGWLLTGDLGYIDEDGFLFIVGRKKDLIISKGMNIYPREIEEVLLDHQCVEECAVVGKSCEVNGEVPVAFIKLKDNCKLSERELRNYLQKKIANYKIPRMFFFVENFPKNASGKILKRVLKKTIENIDQIN